MRANQDLSTGIFQGGGVPEILESGLMFIQADFHKKKRMQVCVFYLPIFNYLLFLIFYYYYYLGWGGGGMYQ